MVLGIIALCQPWNLFLHRYGLTIIIVGLLDLHVHRLVRPEGGRRARVDAPKEEGHS